MNIILNSSPQDATPIVLPPGAPVLDLTQGYPGLAPQPSIGRYNEDRKNIYTAPQYQSHLDAPALRTLHMGYDFFMPAGTPVYAMRNGKVFAKKYRDQLQDYGYTMIIEHDCVPQDFETIEPDFTFIQKVQKLYVLYGHLGHTSEWNALQVGDRVKVGQCLGHIGIEAQNGGWPEHLHLQISTVPPKECDMLGVVDPKDSQNWQKIYPNPALFKGVKMILSTAHNKGSL